MFELQLQEEKRGEGMKTIEQLGISPMPWYIEKNTGVLCAKSEHYKHPIVDDYGNFDNNNDKRLIAAAPELYEALAAMISCAEKEAPFTMESRMSIAMDMARKAIKKAGGAE